jgi:chromosome segregation protein
LFLKRLDLSGFKSFAPHTTTELQPGIVVVVGPNGSGKSNIADGVRWVLGEQSAKAVRARKAEEVIFAGSATRQPLGMAEASLVLDNADGSLPIEFAEVRVTRRLYRSGDSEYLLNGARVRLRDITQLLLHAGLSPDSYTVIGQGSIDELILQRPEERRIAFESAADIRRHQLRLNETRSRLTSTETNLVRVQDVLAELAPHVRRLKTQADRAARAESFRAELHELLVRYYRLRLLQTTRDRDHADRQLHLATQAAERAEADTLASEQALGQVDATLAALDEQLAVLRPRAGSYRVQSAATERALAVTRERAAGLQDRRAAAESEFDRLESQLQRLDAERAAHAGDAELQADELESAGGLDEARERVSALTATLQTARAERERAIAARITAQQRVETVERQLAELERDLHALEATVAVEEARAADRGARLRTLESQLEQLEQDETALRTRQAATQAALDEASERHATRSEAERTTAEALREANQQADRLQGAIAALGAPKPADLDQAHMPPRWRELLADLPVLGLAGELATRIQPIERLLAGYQQRIVVLPDDAGAREAHRRLAAIASAAAAWAVLSLDGLLLTPGGETPLEAADEGSGLADWRRQVRELEAELASAERARTDAEQAHIAAAHEREAAAEADRAAREASNAATADLEQRQRTRRIVESELHDLRAEQQRGAAELQQHADRYAQVTARVDDMRRELGAAHNERAQRVEQAQQYDAQVAALQEQLNQTRTALAALEAKNAQRQVERVAQEVLRERIESEITETQRSLEATGQTREQLSEQVDESTQREAQLVEELQATLLELAPMEEQLSTAEARRVDLLAQLRSEEGRLTDRRAIERTVREDREGRHVHAQRAADELERLNAEIDETAELESETRGGAAWAEQLRLGLADTTIDAQPTIDLDALRRRITVLQRELRAIGGVADSVVDEFRELSERHDFLNNQSGDLQVAMAELQQAAAELEAHMRERFSTIFWATQEAFQECFARLFGGGEARLVLTEPDDLLRSGVDIVARPPGKKLQGLLSLSGGERALTIVALLFGLLRVNPTPFCVLDEVDAALDEANVQRFANLLADFARGIQFVVVTHNRATMDRADALYGVSMDADGISRIFSIKPSEVARDTRS